MCSANSWHQRRLRDATKALSIAAPATGPLCPGCSADPRVGSRYISAVWDAAHNALNGEEPELGLNIVWSHLCLVNLKNAFWRCTTGPEAEDAQWSPY